MVRSRPRSVGDLNRLRSGTHRPGLGLRAAGPRRLLAFSSSASREGALRRSPRCRQGLALLMARLGVRGLRGCCSTAPRCCLQDGPGQTHAQPRTERPYGCHSPRRHGRRDHRRNCQSSYYGRIERRLQHPSRPQSFERSELR